MRWIFASTLLPAALALALTVPASAAHAQQGAKQAEKGVRDRGAAENVARPRPALQRRAAGQARGVPPGWCIGRGNPHNTPENCGYRSLTHDRRDGRNPTGRSFEEAHTLFHRDHDSRCRARAAERPLDVEWQVRVRAECTAEHDRWHARNDPSWNRR
jgi:hypothetical protein